MVMILLSFYKYYQNSWYSPISSNSPVNCKMIVTKLWFVAWFLDFYDKNAILLKEAGSTRFQNLQERFGNILRIAPLAPVQCVHRSRVNGITSLSIVIFFVLKRSFTHSGLRRWKAPDRKRSFICRLGYWHPTRGYKIWIPGNSQRRACLRRRSDKTS